MKRVSFVASTVVAGIFNETALLKNETKGEKRAEGISFGKTGLYQEETRVDN